MRGRLKRTRGRSETPGPPARRAVLFGAEAAQLVEFALVLPFLVALAAGIFDFGAAYRLKQKLTNAAREGTRIAIGQPTADLTQAAPLSVQAVRNAVVNYLASEDLDTSFIATSPTKTGPLEWTYSSTTTGDPILVIDRGVAIPDPGSGALIVSTRVTLNYPYTWSFAQIIQVLGPSASFAGSFTISTDVLMKNLT